MRAESPLARGAQSHHHGAKPYANGIINVNGIVYIHCKHLTLLNIRFKSWALIHRRAGRTSGPSALLAVSRPSRFAPRPGATRSLGIDASQSTRTVPAGGCARQRGGRGQAHRRSGIGAVEGNYRDRIDERGPRLSDAVLARLGPGGSGRRQGRAEDLSQGGDQLSMCQSRRRRSQRVV